MRPKTRGTARQQQPTATTTSEDDGQQDAGTTRQPDSGTQEDHLNAGDDPTAVDDARTDDGDGGESSSVPTLTDVMVDEGQQGKLHSRPRHYEPSSDDDSEEDTRPRSRRASRASMDERRRVEIEWAQLRKEREAFNKDMEERLRRMEEEKRRMMGQGQQHDPKVSASSTPPLQTRISQEGCDGSRVVNATGNASPASAAPSIAGAAIAPPSLATGGGEAWELVKRTLNTLQDALQLATQRGGLLASSATAPPTTQPAPLTSPFSRASASSRVSTASRQQSPRSSALVPSAESSLAESMTNLLNAHRAPALELLPFSGSVLEFPRFRASVRSTIERYCGAEDRLPRLLKALTGQALVTIGNADLMGPVEGYEAAMRRLEARYGSPEDLAYEWLRRLTEYASESCRDWSDQLRACVDALTSTDSLERVGRGRELNEVVSRMPKKIRTSFAAALTNARQHGLRHPGFQELLRIAEKEGESEMDRALFDPHPVTSPQQDVRRVEDRSKNQKKSPASSARVYTTSAASAPIIAHGTYPAARAVCPLDDGQHKLIDCRKFAAMEVSQRTKAARQYNLCFRCLETGHFSRDCQEVCNACKGRHHVMLHRDPDSRPGPTGQKRPASSPAGAQPGKRRKFYHKKKGESSAKGETKPPTHNYATMQGSTDQA